METPDKPGIKGNWSEKKKRLQREYPDLTDNDLVYEEGNENELFERIENRLGTSRGETHTIIRKI